MKKLYNNRKLLFIICFLTTSFLFAHGSLSKRIKAKTAEIKKHPKNSKLYFQRGFLYEQHKEFNKAINDYIKSGELGNSDKQLLYRKAQTYYYQNKFSNALKASNLYLDIDSKDVKINKLHAQILVQLGKFDKALEYYSYFIKNTIDINPENVIEYSEIYLSKDNTNYPKAIEAIDIGLNKLGKNTFSLQLKKLEYLETSLQVDKAIEQYNYFILNTNRKEFWYYKKAKYLFKNDKIQATKIALHQAKSAIAVLNDKVKNTTSIKNLENNINKLESNLATKN